MLKFFMQMIPPSITAQQKGVKVIKGKPMFFEKPAVRDARQKLAAHLSKHIPKSPAKGAVRLITKWLIPRTDKHFDGEWKTSRPDIDNLQKLLKDVMTDLSFWKDDSQVASEIAEKFWSDTSGIYIEVHNLPVIGNDTNSQQSASQVP